MSVFTIKAVTAKAPSNAPNLAVESWKKERKYFSGNDESGKSHLNYMKLGTPTEEKTEIDMRQERVFGIFNESGMLNEKSEQRLRNELKNTNSHIWTGVINFEKEEGIKHCSSIEQAEKGFNKAFPRFCTEANLNRKNLNYVVALHENSELYHLHYMFYEKKPQRISSVNKELCYSKKFVIDKNAVLNMPKIIDEVFGGLLQENTMKTEKVKKIGKERVGEYNFTADLKNVARTIKNEEFLTRNIPYEKWYLTLSKTAKRAVDKLTVKIIKSNGVKNYTDALKETPKKNRVIFRDKTYNDIGLKIIRKGLEANAVDEEKEERLEKITKKRKTYDLNKKEQIDYRLVKKTAKIRTERIAEEIKQININPILKMNVQEVLKQDEKPLRRKL